MNRFKDILVGIDFPDCSKSALQPGMRVAQWNGATLPVLHVVESLVVREFAETVKVPLFELREMTMGCGEVGALSSGNRATTKNMNFTTVRGLRAVKAAHHHEPNQ